MENTLKKEVAMNYVTVSGDIDTLEETSIDFNTFVGVSLRYFSCRRVSVIRYCRRDELRDWYNEQKSAGNIVTPAKESNDGNWSEVYTELCEYTAESLVGNSYGWMMDLPRFYSDLLTPDPVQTNNHTEDKTENIIAINPADVLTKMMEIGLKYSEAISGDTWCDSVVNGEEVFTQLNQYDSHAPNKYDICCYSYTKEGVVDYSDTVYAATVTKSFIIDTFNKYHGIPVGIKYIDVDNVATSEYIEKHIKQYLISSLVDNGLTLESILTESLWEYVVLNGIKYRVHLEKDHNDNGNFNAFFYEFNDCSTPDTYNESRPSIQFTVEDLQVLIEMYTHTLERKTIQGGKSSARVPVKDIDTVLMDDKEASNAPITNGVYITKELFDKLDKVGLIPNGTNTHNIGKSDYAKHMIQPWNVFASHPELNYWECDIIKRIMRSKDGERLLDLNKCVHIIDELIRQELLKSLSIKQLECPKCGSPVHSTGLEYGCNGCDTTFDKVQLVKS